MEIFFRAGAEKYMLVIAHPTIPFQKKTARD
jgi:hypothetical protein